ncbi:MAG: type IV pilus secretin PilQ [Acidiferrobacterales bacterium]
MTMEKTTTASRAVLQAFAAWSIAAAVGVWGMLGNVASAGEIASLAWEDDAGSVLLIRMEGKSEYTTTSLEGGQRLRITLADTSLGSAAGELERRGNVKGVYPYLADNGGSVNVDLLLTEPGRLQVEETDFGFRVTALPGPTGEGVSPSPTPAPAAAPAATAEATPNGGNVIKNVRYAVLPGSRVQISLEMAQPPAVPTAFSITNPARIALDFPNTRVGLANKTIPIKEGAVLNVTAIEAQGRTRVVLSLVRPVSYETATKGNVYAITLDTPVRRIAPAQEPQTTRFAAARAGGKYDLRDIDFRRGTLGEGLVTITLSDPAVGIDLSEQAGQIVVDFLNTAIPTGLQRRLDVVDFATPVQTIDAFPIGRNTRMVITPKGRFEHAAFQAGNVFTINVKPILEKEEERPVDEFGYSGEKLSLNFQNIDVRAALQVLADFTGLNFVVSDTVKGSLTLRLKDVPWDQALDIIVESKNLAIRRAGNVITVAPADEVAAREKARLEASRTVRDLEPLVSELIQINYAKADDISNLLRSIKALPTAAQIAGEHPVFGPTATGQPEVATAESNTLLSPRGQVTVDARTNSLLIQDTPGKIAEVRKLIAQLDQPVRQVMIETRLVEATESFSRNLGVKFGVRSQNTTNDFQVTQRSTLDTTGLLTTDGLNVNLPAAGLGAASAGSIALTIAKLGSGGLLSLELSALEQEGLGKIISSPRLITANQQKASIEQGEERVFTTTVLGVGSVVTKRATLSLEVTPQITPDDRVLMDVVVTKDNFADAALGLLNIKELRTQVLLDNGETVVIGGIYEREQQDDVTKIPWFGDIPVLGWLFKNKALRDEKTELLIFLTPRILAEDLTLT